MAWLDQVTDSCSIPKPNSGNPKHGGSIAYQSTTVNASLTIEPLVVRRLWNGGQANDPECNSVDTRHYIDQETLDANIPDYCERMAESVGSVAAPGAEFTRSYNVDSPDNVTIKTSWPTGTQDYQTFQVECSYYLTLIR